MWLGAFVVLICGISFSAKFAAAVMGYSGAVPRLLSMLFVTEDQSIPSWYSSFALLFCAALLFLVAFSVRVGGGSHFARWGILGAIFFYLSVDEGVGIHEQAGPLGEMILRGAGFGSGVSEFRTWVVPGAIFTLIVVLAYAGFVRSLPARTRNSILLSGLLFVAGALGMEVFHEVYIKVNGGLENLSVIENIVRDIVLPHIEEFLEMIGIVVFIYSLLDYLEGFAADYRFLLGKEYKDHGSH